jgi:putative salt-induced outer membrane protein YdiY
MSHFLPSITVFVLSLCLPATALSAQQGETEQATADTLIDGTAVVSYASESEQSVDVEEVLSADNDADTEAAEQEPVKTELPPDYVMEWEPEAVEYDWIQLTSGEWLKGEFKSMYNKSVEFDSDKLDLLNIDWEDVKFLKTYRDSQINIDGYEPISGKLKISGKKITITEDGNLQVFNRDELIALAPTGDREADLWSIKLTLSLSGKSGNTDQLDYTSKLNMKRRTAKRRFIIDYIGNISKVRADQGVLIETVNNHRINSNYDVYATRYFYYTPLGVEYYRDPFQNIDQRVSVGIGIGYTIVDTDAVEWTIGGGPAYINTRYLSVVAGNSDNVDSAALAFNTAVDAELTSNLDFIFKYNTQLAETEAGGYTHHLVTTFESEITGRLDFDISLYWDRTTHPVSDDQGVQPEEDDYRFAVGLTYTY